MYPISLPFLQITTFEVAAKERKEILVDAREKLQKLLEITVTDYHASWPNVRKTLEHQNEYLCFVDLEGNA